VTPSTKARVTLLAWAGTCGNCGAGLGPGAPRGGVTLQVICPLCGEPTTVLAEIELRLLSTVEGGRV
jgi:hypothetical protein